MHKKLSIVVLALSFSLGCALLEGGGPKKREVVPHCFADPTNPEPACIMQRENADGYVVTTRCIGPKNKEAKPNLRGRCAEKICDKGDPTDCTVRGEPLVIEEYAELARASLFASDETTKPGRELDMPVVKATPIPTPAPTPLPTPIARPQRVRPTPVPQDPPMKIALRPKMRRSAPRSTRKKLCIYKSDKSAPKNLRGQCAIRTCRGTPPVCTYKGPKQVFDWAGR